MKRELLYLLLAALSTTFACQSSTEDGSKQTQAQKVYQEAMVIHDEIMPEMDKMMQLKKMLNTRMDSLQQMDSVAYADTLDLMHSAVQDLEEADQAMMQWMRGVKKVPGMEGQQSAYAQEMETKMPADTTKLVKIQREQKKAIEGVKEQMEESIRQALALLGQAREE